MGQVPYNYHIPLMISANWGYANHILKATTYTWHSHRSAAPRLHGRLIGTEGVQPAGSRSTSHPGGGGNCFDCHPRGFLEYGYPKHPLPNIPKSLIVVCPLILINTNQIWIILGYPILGTPYLLEYRDKTRRNCIPNVTSTIELPVATRIK